MNHFKHLPEPFRIRVIEPVKTTSREYREQAILNAGMNPFLLDSEDIFIDLLTDSGTGAITQNMQAAMLRGDEAYSGSRSYHTLAATVKQIFGYQHTIPTHQGRGAEQLYIPVLIRKREREKGGKPDNMVALSNYFFDTTQGHTQINRCVARNIYCANAFNTDVYEDFKGNFDLAKLEQAIIEIGAENVPYIVSTITCNSAGGQPVSLANLKGAYEIAQKYQIPVVMDSARFAENAYFIQQREAAYTDWSIEQITYESYKYADILAMSAKKDAMVQIGGLLCFKDDSLLDVYTECRTLCVLQEGFPTYGGLEGGAMERLAVGLVDGMRQDWLAYRIQQVQYLVEGLQAAGIYCQQAGGHAAFVDAGKLLPHIPTEQFPAHALACELYKTAGIRAVEIGSLLLGRDPQTGKQHPCPAELLRLTIPRATYTQTHMDFIIEAFQKIKENIHNIKGLEFVYEPSILRHFTARLKEVD
ncbi:tryptophanase [Testudinibacter sp. TR-2022]|uniref:tryptophanase n=1 Tax=Testudinibacter sp. TR-2022 TaxID=2585029 RepID=UPI0011199C81|nr:tryptophanase [Testudinibacter sp. TR-2022]TNH01270.1 tryptophanase [Pasteurellaceae bacterium Phil31]TNH09070.1 tryptophanase [Testudinibacter sp. TR-2022]TNH12907.1 tryptophanase [Testudinibacter sp. TR-2022]TNH13123.1 tryptophanase [Testudinibacter sp. TR-2022]TNH18194.1 tryptophanase [Testudinibacter sp. TR-2022]